MAGNRRFIKHGGVAVYALHARAHFTPSPASTSAQSHSQECRGAEETANTCLKRFKFLLHVIGTFVNS
ncbi:hypothetical protein CBOM_03309 [Ceraceosorus bombacis]|uniref:Uncharacterized protein n=1 Tax=Ceraceosorus bombacis TaxID=401625 RepID=A0A0P1BMS1_9BASI|nr:hypothetical protein CBOM_03309 [Ceraceosorus bombacis]